MINRLPITPKNFIQQQWAQLSRIGYPFIFASFIALAIIAGVYFLASITHTPLALMTKDPATINHTRFYVGLLSTAGSMLWTATVAICLIGSLLIRASKNSPVAAHFLLLSALCSLVLMLDDTLLLHENVLPELIGISEKAIYVVYLVGAALYLFYFRRYILETDYYLLILAGGLFGFSLIFDNFVTMVDVSTFIEDSLKFVGLIFWVLYFSRVTLYAVRIAFTGARNTVELQAITAEKERMKSTASSDHAA